MDRKSSKQQNHDHASAFSAVRHTRRRSALLKASLAPLLAASALILTGCGQAVLKGPARSLFAWTPPFATGAVKAGRESTSNQPAVQREHRIEDVLSLAQLSERSGQMSQAEHLYQVVMQRQPENPVPYHRLGIMRAKEGQFEQSNELMLKALQLAPSNAKLVGDIGYCYYLQNRLDEAEQVLRRASEMKPDDQAIAINLALVLGEQGRDEECMATLRRAGNEQQACANMAFIYAQRGELERAEATYSRALTLDESLRPAALALAQLGQRKRMQYRPAPSGQVLQVDYQQAQASPPPRAVEPARPDRSSCAMQAPPAYAPQPQEPAAGSQFGDAVRTAIRRQTLQRADAPEGNRIPDAMRAVNFAPVASYEQASARLQASGQPGLPPGSPAGPWRPALPMPATQFGPVLPAGFQQSFVAEQVAPAPPPRQ